MINTRCVCFRRESDTNASKSVKETLLIKTTTTTEPDDGGLSAPTQDVFRKKESFQRFG